MTDHDHTISDGNFTEGAERQYMSSNLPTRDELEPGMTVEVEQDDGDRIIDEIGAVLGDERSHPDGILVKLKSGVRGRVKRIGPEH